MGRAEDAMTEVFARWLLRTHAPAIAWGLVRDGELVASGGLGSLRAGEDLGPDEDSVFRIASMTKSFTGAALLSLVADGRVRLDEPVATYVPEVGTWPGPTTDSPPLTVRHLVSMESGLPTDDPWADRHMGLTDEGMDALIAAGVVQAWAPGVRFEYSNLAWGLVGQVIERVAGARAQDVITSRLLTPLGMHATSWTRPDHGAIAEPYRWEGDAWRHEGPDVGDGTIAPMGGLWTTVRDLATWVGFFQDAWPPRDGPDDGPVPRWARREQQQARRVEGVQPARPRPDGPSRSVATGYGIGLAIRFDPRLGGCVGHSGGLPGYGSHMRWIPDRGIGLIALSNVTYGRMGAAIDEAFEVLADLDELGPEHRDPAPMLEGAAQRSAGLLNDWTDGAADALFAANVGQDESYERRARQAHELIERHGRLTVERVEAETPLRGSFSAARGLVRVELGLNHAGTVQWLDVTDRSRPGSDPILRDPATIRTAEGSAYVILRPVADLADAFARWQGEVLDRLGGARAVAPTAHATLKAFGSSSAPIGEDDVERVAEVVATWATVTPPIELRAESLAVFDGEERVPIVRLAEIPALGDLWRRAAEAGLPAGYGDGIGADAWIPHLSLAYPSEVADGPWSVLSAWTETVDTGAVASVAFEAELVVFLGGRERRAGRFPLGR